MPSRLISAVTLFFLLALSGFSQEASRDLSLSEYIAELDQIYSEVKLCPQDPRAISTIIGKLPPQWAVQTRGRSYAVSSAWLNSSLFEITKNNSAESCSSALNCIAVLKADVLALEKPAPNFAADRRALERILARREFRGVHGQTAWDRLKQKLMLFLLRIFGGILGSSAFPEISQIVIWTLVGIAVVVLAVWAFKTLERNIQLETIGLPDSAPVSAKPWIEWMAEAQAAGAAERWRDAVHLSYWAGISYLESHGLWRPDRARTPREYLRLLSSSSEHRDSLCALTREFEAIWYGYAEASPESFSESLKYLESIGCHSN